MNLDLGFTRLLIDTCREHGLLRNQAAYVLATAYHETAHTMQPVKETVMAWHNDKFPSDQEVIRRLDNAMAKGLLPQVSRPYWREGWFGRGFVQLTHKANYERAERELDIPFTTKPEEALNPDFAATVIVVGMKEGWFTGKKLSDYITLSQSNFRSARRIVNGLDRAAEFARTARTYDGLLLAEGYGVVKDEKDSNEKPILNPQVEPDDAIVEKPLTQSTTIFSAVGASLSGILTALVDNPIAQTVLVVAMVGFAAWIIRERMVHRR
jgi:predicted chitinase